MEALKDVGLGMEMFQEDTSRYGCKWHGAEKRQRQIVHSDGGCCNIQADVIREGLEREW